MTHRIEKDQEYQSCAPTPSMPGETYTRIRVVRDPRTAPNGSQYGSAQIVTVTDSGREVRKRSILITQLHESPTTGTSQPRRTGYYLVRHADGRPAGGDA